MAEPSVGDRRPQFALRCRLPQHCVPGTDWSLPKRSKLTTSKRPVGVPPLDAPCWIRDRVAV
jgi:hypothetical protein